MASMSLGTDGLQLRKSSTGQIIDDERQYLSDDQQIVINPDAPLLPGTQYQLRISGPQNMAGFPVNPEVRTSFQTEWDIDDAIDDLAHDFAPVIYQDTAFPDAPDTHGDIPTTIDFDGNLDAADNLSHATSGDYDLPAHLYYTYSATESHHFLHYILYYPLHRTSSGTHLQHDLLGVLKAIDKDTEELIWIQTIHPNSSSSTTRTPYLVDRPDAPPAVGSEDPTLIAPDTLEQGRRFALYIPSGEHAGCFWYERDSGFFPPDCTGEGEQFLSGDGLVIRPADEGQTFDQAITDGDFQTLDYGLSSFIDPFWLHLGDYESNLYGGNPRFLDFPEDRPQGPRDDAYLMWNRLATDADADGHRGLLPFRWVRSSSSGAYPDGGPWFFDPAWFLGIGYQLGDDYSTEYCYHFFLNIDRRNEAPCQVSP